MHVTVITAHPFPDSFSRGLARAWAEGASAHAEVTHFDATELAFDPVLRTAYRGRMVDEPDLLRVREALFRSAHVTWAFPMWWGGLPAALKGLVDRLFLPKEAFSYEGGAMPRGLLAGRTSRWIATMDSPAPWYWVWNGRALEGSFARGTLRFVGFGPVERTLVTRAGRLSEEGRRGWLKRVEQAGRRDVERVKALQPRFVASAA